jgi:hypothetical protein
MDRYHKAEDASRIQVVGIVEDGKYPSLAGDPQPAMFLPILQIAFEPDLPGGALESRSHPLAAAVRIKLLYLNTGLPSRVQTRTEAMDFVRHPSRMATVSLGLLGVTLSALRRTMRSDEH